MGISKQDAANVAKFTGLILGTVFTGGTGAAVAAGAGLLGNLLGGDDDDADEDAWKRKMFPKWIALAADLAEKPINDQAREMAVRGSIEADWTEHYAKRPKKSVVDQLHANVVFVVKARMAVTPNG
jgi:hypothetical protein